MLNKNIENKKEDNKQFNNYAKLFNLINSKLISPHLTVLNRNHNTHSKN